MIDLFPCAQFDNFLKNIEMEAYYISQNVKLFTSFCRESPQLNILHKIVEMTKI